MCAQSELDLGGTSSKEPQGEDQGLIATEGETLGLIARNYLACIKPSSRQEFDDFVRYMEKMRLVITGVSVGSVIITVVCTSLEILERLWEDYKTGHLNEVAQKFLITADVIKEFGEVKVTVTISEEDYKAGRAYFLQFSGKP